MDNVTNINPQNLIVTSLISSFRTGNAILDTVIAVMVGSAIVWIMNKKPDCNKIFEWLFTRAKRKASSYKHHMYFDHITMASKDSVNDGNSILINATLTGLKSTGCMDHCAEYHVMNLISTSRDLSVRERNEAARLFYVPKSNVVWNGMQFEFTYTVDLGGEKGHTTTTFGIGINYNDLKSTETVLSGWRQQEIERLYPIKKREDPLYFWFIENTKTTEGKTNYSFAKRKWKSMKTFDSLFFDRKEEILGLMTHFKNQSGPWHPKKERTNTFRMFLHGLPGCGKTSFIKAWANRDGLHIFKINMNLIDSNEDLLSIISDRSLYVDDCDETVELNRRLYVLEDLDCDGCSDIIDPRSNVVNDCDVKPEVKELAIDKKVIKKTDKKTDKNEMDVLTTLFRKKSNISLSGFLNMLDGIYELDGVRLVITTNDKSKFDPAIFRPGRMDVTLELGHMSHGNIRGYLERYYGSISDIEAAPLDGVFLTPGKVEQICQSYDNVQAAVAEIAMYKK